MPTNPATALVSSSAKGPATLSFEDLRYLSGTGQSYTISGSGRDRRYGYKSGVDTPSGNYEIHEWTNLMHSLIHHSGEELLHQQLSKFESENNVLRRTKEDMTHHVLILHSMRIFDNPLWAAFISFNQKYRPDILAATERVTIIPDCCKTPGEVTLARYKKPSQSITSGRPSLPCPICGRWSCFTLPSSN